MRVLLSSVAAMALLTACNGEPGEMAEDAADAVTEVTEDAVEAVEELAGGIEETVEEAVSAPTLDQVLTDPRREADRARDQYRNPRETLEFFGVEASDTVVEALPGGGWYGRILAPWLAAEGRYYGLNYSMSIFERLFADMTDEQRARLEGWEASFPATAAEWGGPAAGGYTLGSVPESAAGTADVVLYIRALHNMARFGELDVAVDDAWTLLRSGGVVGVVQHRAPADETDERADGSRGYLREADVIAAFEARGFVLEASSEINANPDDPADHEIGVWALPPSLRVDSDEQRETNAAIGETDRMTLRFRKP
ncbi:MAG: class I SAM-dependent methyltransferase [Oceanicaulis sp.]|uniref:class I SAM-dependent methyltransferase n=1 Tax=Glycocaulis sp. TaxID=1969725 RepID=UPI0025BAD354|nr:methyltransferase [Glycocaulis sp.]MCC5982262.1 class I SAM-dependent methyltransferase [Oceanicaulis sp.]MCH8522136.1 methyltransferase [Glycocaulis sp.]